MRALLLPLSMIVALAATGCSKKSETFTSNVTLNRMDAVRYDDKGKPLTFDLEFDWHECPGQQVEVIRGDAAFAECISKAKIGDKVPVKVRFEMTKDNVYDWDVTEVNGCARPPLDDDDASFDTVQECSDLKAHGAVVGFTCNRLPQAELLAKCPWFRRH